MIPWQWGTDRLPKRGLLVELLMNDNTIKIATRELLRDGYEYVDDTGRVVVDNGIGIDYGDRWVDMETRNIIHPDDVKAWRELVEGR